MGDAPVRDAVKHIAALNRAFDRTAEMSGQIGKIVRYAKDLNKFCN